MDTIVDNVTIRLAARIRAEREARGWSPADLAMRAGVSRAMIAKIEAGQSSPTAMMLGKLSGAFELTMSTLLARAETQPRSRVVRRREQSLWQDPDSGYVRRQIFPTPGSTLPLDLIEVDLPAGAILRFPASSYAFIHQLMWVLSGELTWIEGEEEHVLGAGDGVELGAPRDCRFENRCGETCTYVVLVLRDQK